MGQLWGGGGTCGEAVGQGGYLWGRGSTYGAEWLLMGQLWRMETTYRAAMGQGELLMGQGGYLWGSCASPTGPPPPDVGDVTLSPPHALPHGAMGCPTTAAVELKLKGAPPPPTPPSPTFGDPEPHRCHVWGWRGGEGKCVGQTPMCGAAAVLFLPLNCCFSPQNKG